MTSSYCRHSGMSGSFDGAWGVSRADLFTEILYGKYYNFLDFLDENMGIIV